MAEHIYPNEEELFAEVNEGDRWQPVPLLESLKAKAGAAGKTVEISRAAQSPHASPVHASRPSLISNQRIASEVMESAHRAPWRAQGTRRRREPFALKVDGDRRLLPPIGQ
jgi:hypothetical protein